MDISPWNLLKLIVPKLPLILKLMITNRLGLSPCSDKQDPRTEIVVTVIRETLKTTKPLGEIQKLGLTDPGVKGPLWISTSTCPAPDNDVRDAVIRGIKELGDGSEQYDLPSTADVQGEWTGHRQGADKNTPMPAGSQREHYDALMKEVKTKTTVLYFHGGAYFLMDPISHRQLTASLAKRTGGRCFSVRYRLAPQTAFPGQLIDALTTYLYLLSPPEGAFHEPVAAKNIVFAGDSAGGHLSFSLLLLILTLKRAGVNTVRFHGKDVPLEIPAGVAGNSPWLDICRAMPSINTNAKYDYLDPPTGTGLPLRPMPEDDVWPTKPPRADIFCRASTMTHPLCSPLQATSEMWKGSPPVFMCLGNEGLEDEITVLARKLHHAGVPVEYIGYEGQPHCFGMIFPTTPAGMDCIARWANFIAKAVDGHVESSGQWAIAKSNPIQYRKVDLSTIGVTDEFVANRTAQMKKHGEQREAERIAQYQRAKL